MSWLLSIFHTQGVPPSSQLPLYVHGLDTCAFIDLRAAFERAFDVSKFGVGIITFIC
jgi:hypothetical protein